MTQFIILSVIFVIVHSISDSKTKEYVSGSEAKGN